jgi:hypothetical protein
MQKTGYRIQDARYEMLDSGFKIQDAGYMIQSRRDAMFIALESCLPFFNPNLKSSSRAVGLRL